MIWILLTLLISIVDLYISYKINPKLKKGYKVFNPNESDDVIGAITLSIVPILNVVMLLRIIILVIANIYLKNYDY